VFGVVVESSGDSIVFTSFRNGIWRMDLTTLDETTVLTPGFANFGPGGLAIDGAGDLWSSEGEVIVKRDPITGDPIETIGAPRTASSCRTSRSIRRVACSSRPSSSASTATTRSPKTGNRSRA